MCVKTWRRCAVADVTVLRNPVLAARAVMGRSPHALSAGPEVDDLGRAAGLECVEPSFFSTDARRDQLRRVQATGEETIVLDHDGQALTQAPGANAAPLD